MTRTLLAGPDLRAGGERWAAHVARVGALPAVDSRLTGLLGAAGLRGRGGAGFPAAVKWEAVARRARGGGAVVVANGAEGEPLSGKDRLLMGSRPHLVLDGALLAATAVGADRIVLYVGAEHGPAMAAMRGALAERPEPAARRVEVVGAPTGYVSGEESAAVRCIDGGPALPRDVPPRPFERGVAGRPTLVQNVETLAHAALIARHGDAWFRDLADGGESGTALLTVTGAVAAPGVVELPQGTPLGAAVTAAGGAVGDPRAVLLGGWFGGWVGATDAWSLPLDAAALRARGRGLGCGVIAVLGPDRCGIRETASITGHLARASARQCGPCVFGLRAIAAAMDRIAAGTGTPETLADVRRWAAELPGRGACHHPDGAAALIASAVLVFADEFDVHVHGGRCTATTVMAGAR